MKMDFLGGHTEHDPKSDPATNLVCTLTVIILSDLFGIVISCHVMGQTPLTIRTPA